MAEAFTATIAVALLAVAFALCHAVFAAAWAEARRFFGWR